MAMVDNPPTGMPPLWSLEGVLYIGAASYEPKVVSWWANRGRAGVAYVELLDAYRATAWAHTIRPNVYLVQVARPISDLYLPVELVVTLLDIKQHNFAEWHRVHCADSCFMCQNDPSGPVSQTPGGQA